MEYEYFRRNVRVRVQVSVVNRIQKIQVNKEAVIRRSKDPTALGNSTKDSSFPCSDHYFRA